MSDFLRSAKVWLGLAPDPGGVLAGHGHSHGDGGGHGHTHGVMDPIIATTDRGIWAIKWSFAILAVTAIFQIVVVAMSGSVALLADTIHNFGDATTAIPLWVAFRLARRKPSATFTYGLGRVEDLAGIAIVLVILASALVAGYEAIDRLIHPQPVTELGWLVMAGIVGFVGNEAVAVFRIRVGREINSAALIADGYHARTDGLTSLAVVAGAVGVWLGFPLADPIVGLLITVAIFGIVWQSARSVLTRMLDGIDPAVTAELRHTAEHVRGIAAVTDARARWLGHKLHADVTIAVDEDLSLAQANRIAASYRHALFDHLPVLSAANIRFAHVEERDQHDRNEPKSGGHHHAPEPFIVACDLADGTLSIVDTANGERMRLVADRISEDLVATVEIARPDGVTERLVLVETSGDPRVFESTKAPEEPHEFDAILHLSSGAQRIALPFRMEEPDGHHH